MQHPVCSSQRLDAHPEQHSLLLDVGGKEQQHWAGNFEQYLSFLIFQLKLGVLPRNLVKKIKVMIENTYRHRMMKREICKINWSRRQ